MLKPTQAAGSSLWRKLAAQVQVSAGSQLTASLLLRSLLRSTSTHTFTSPVPSVVITSSRRGCTARQRTRSWCGFATYRSAPPPSPTCANTRHTPS